MEDGCDLGTGPDYVYAEDLGLTPDEVRARWPQAVEYGPSHAPYWDRAELEDTIEEDLW
jgi:hypothetical protein